VADIQKQGGIEWIAQLPRLNDTIIAYNDEYQRARLRALQSVDEMVENLIRQLESKGVLDNTYIFYTTDNGYHISQHRMHPGKECSFDTDIHIPLIVRGPGIPAGRSLDVVTSHTDLSPTIIALAGGSQPNFDGLPIPLSDEDQHKRRSEHVNVEFWGVGIPEGKFGYNGSVGDYTNTNVYPNNTYKTLRLIGETYSLSYTVWCSNAKELYNVKADPGQMHDVLGDTALATEFDIAGRGLDNVVTRLDALLMVLKSCKGQDCINPWKVLHPDGDIENLHQALHQDFDVFYQRQPKVAFTECQFGYIREVEGPQHVNRFGFAEQDVHKENGETLLVTQGLADGQQASFRYRGHWSLWV